MWRGRVWGKSQYQVFLQGPLKWFSALPEVKHLLLSEAKDVCLFDSAARVMLQNLILLPVSLLLSSDWLLPTTPLKLERFQDHESASDLIWPCGQCSRFCLHVRYSFSLHAVLCCNARRAEQMGKFDGRAQGWQLLCNYKSGMRFEGSKILSAGALVQEHVSSRPGSAPEEECRELCDRQHWSFLSRFMFWHHFDHWDFNSPFFGH